jgi:hypothetical protein
MEQAAAVTLAVLNRTGEALRGASVALSMGGLAEQTTKIGTLDADGSCEVTYEVDTTLRPGDYALSATVASEGREPCCTETVELTIVPRTLPHTMPVIMWGAGLKEIARLKEIGFTHAIGIAADLERVWQAGGPVQIAGDDAVAETFADMDNALAKGIRAVAGFSPGRWAREKEPCRRIGPDGKPYEDSDDVCGLLPEIQAFCRNAGTSLARTYAAHPCLEAALIHTEVRGESRLCYHNHDEAALKQATGLGGIPEGLAGMRGTPYTEVDGLPDNRVVPDDHPIYIYYRWVWREGDGWNTMHTQVHEGFGSTGREDLWTFHDPAVRVASVYGNGGDVDVLSQWTYSYPDPIRIGLATDELFCMAAGADRPDQTVMKMTQIIWYRSQTAPEPGEEAGAQHAAFDDHDTAPMGTGRVDASGQYQAAWERKIPDARFITISPMHLREAFWVKISRPIQGIMYHGWQSLVDCGGDHRSYRYTHPETRHELRRLVDTVVEPLGPTLVQVPDCPSDVAFLESFASQMFAGRGTYGWNHGWAGDAYLILHYAQLQPRVVYDETVKRDGLGAFKVLVLADCDVMLASVVEEIKAFQNRGGIVIGDDHLCPAIEPDIMIESWERPREADQARTRMLDAARRLRQELDTRYKRYAESTDPNVITRVRRYGSTDYLFAVNDLREFGDYVGHHGLVMENGLPSDTHLRIGRSSGNVYDLVAHRKLEADREGEGIGIGCHLGPCEGQLLMITEQEIGGIEIQAPISARPGTTITIATTVVDVDGAALDAIVPVRVELLDPHGRAAEFSGHYGARDGRVEISAETAANDVPGLWRIHVEELASGRAAEAYVRVEGVAS